MRINTVLDTDLLARLDALARETGRSRSLVIREASERYLAEHERQKAEEAKKAKMAAASKAQDRLRDRGGHWNGEEEVRKWRDRR